MSDALYAALVRDLNELADEQDMQVTVPQLAALARRAANTARAHHAVPPPPGHGLSPRRVETLRLVAAGLSNPEIAQQMGVSEHTVNSHINDLFRLGGARGRAELIARYYRPIPAKKPARTAAAPARPAASSRPAQGPPPT